MPGHVFRREPEPMGIIAEEAKRMVALGADELAHTGTARFGAPTAGMVVVNGKPRSRPLGDCRLGSAAYRTRSALLGEHLGIPFGGEVVHRLDPPAMLGLRVGLGIRSGTGVPTFPAIGVKPILRPVVIPELGGRFLRFTPRTLLYGFHEIYSWVVPSDLERGGYAHHWT